MLKHLQRDNKLTGQMEQLLCCVFAPHYAAAADWLQSFAMFAARLASVDGVLKTLPLRLLRDQKESHSPRGKSAKSWEACVKKNKNKSEGVRRRSLYLLKWFKVFFFFLFNSHADALACLIAASSATPTLSQTNWPRQAAANTRKQTKNS